MSLAVESRQITKTYGTGTLAVNVLKGIDFDARAGEFVYIAGPSGSGKTTFLSLLGCVLRPTSGNLSLFGQTVSGKTEAELPKLRLSLIGFIFQGNNLIGSLTAKENVAFQLKLRGWSPADANREAVRLLGEVGLSDRVDFKPHDLSGGQRQRVAVARAIAGRPPLILADEPTAALDAQNGKQVVELLRELAKNRGHTVVVVTHDNRIFDLADRIIHLEDGRIVHEE